MIPRRGGPVSSGVISLSPIANAVAAGLTSAATIAGEPANDPEVPHSNPNVTCRRLYPFPPPAGPRYTNPRVASTAATITTCATPMMIAIAEASG